VATLDLPGAHHMGVTDLALISPLLAGALDGFAGEGDKAANLTRLSAAVLAFLDGHVGA
jgi:hypothetical protein